jgi:uncharacterized membrane protein
MINSVPWQTLFRSFTATLFVAAGANHFWHSAFYVRITPPMLPHRLGLVLISGFFEIVGGIGLLIPMLRHAAGWGLCLLLLCVFPANIYMALHADQFADLHAPVWALWLRLPLQPLLMLWVWRNSRGTAVSVGDPPLKASQINTL